MVADCLSRPSITPPSPDINSVFRGIHNVDLELLAQEQTSDPEIQNLLQDNQTSLKLSKCRLPNSDTSLILDDSKQQPRVLVPRNLRQHVFDAVHNLSHPGIRASKDLISERFVWVGMMKDIAESARACVPCQQSKVQRHNTAPLNSFLTPDARFSHVHADLVGPLPESSGYGYLLTIIDRSTKHIEAVPLQQVTTKSIADAFLLHWVGRFKIRLS